MEALRDIEKERKRQSYRPESPNALKLSRLQQTVAARFSQEKHSFSHFEPGQDGGSTKP